MFKNLFKKPEQPLDKKLQEELERKRNEIIQQAARLKKLILDKNTGWADYITLIKEYISAIKQRKVATRLDTIDDKSLAQLKLLDHEIETLTWAIAIPQQFIIDLESAMATLAQEEQSGREKEV